MTGQKSESELARPTPSQLAWQDLEMGLFIHFNMFTYMSDDDWLKAIGGFGTDPNLFNPAKLDTDQWMRAAVAIGAKYAVLTAKHAENFCLWPTKAYDYSVKQCRWRNGKGDVVADFVASCRKHGIKPALYCCMPQIHGKDISGGFRIDGGKTAVQPGEPRWKEVCEQLLTELWGNYGELAEVWFDGGALPPEKGGPDLHALHRRYQPNAVIFQSSASTIRGVTPYEDGCAPYPCWCTINEDGEPTKKSISGDPDGHRWCPPECDTTMRHRIQWAWQPDQDHLVKSLDTLVHIYYNSIGHGCNLLLNANPDTDGLIPAADMRRYEEFGREINRRFGQSLGETSGEGKVIELQLPGECLVDHLIIMEDLRYGQRVRQFSTQYYSKGKWNGYWGDSAIGHKLILPSNQIKASAMRLICDSSVGTPHIRKFAAYNVWRP